MPFETTRPSSHAKRVRRASTLAASTNLLRKKGPIEALQLLEIGRGVIAQLRFGSRTDLATLRKRHPEMAEKFERFQRLLDSLNSSSSPILAEETGMVKQLSKKSKHFAAVQFDNVVDEIRQLPGLRHFLLPPTENELKAAASGGPVVVINVSTLRCDALLLETGGIRSIPLPNLHHKDVVQNTELLKSARGWSKGSFGAKSRTLQILEWLWDAVAGPFLEELGIQEPPRDHWPHVWWIPTGLLSSLPLHAAGRHRSKSLETVIDRVVSSYSPSIKALLYTQRQSMSLNHVLTEVLLVSMETTPGCAPIGKARDEITAVEELLPALALKKKLEKPCKGDVVDGLRRCNIFHFAGHSMPDSVDPSKSRLLLRDWQETPLTVEDLIDLNRHDNPPFLAFLSACSTGASPADRLHDESINLMTACQLAGFRHTVGSLWDANDRYSVDAAREFYKAIGGGGAIDDKAVAWGVHSAARHIRECTRDGGLSADREGDVFAWAPYIHIGP